ncbi:MAG: hypothetical protein U0694_04030 [Anaerolineae bacterium]
MALNAVASVGFYMFMYTFTNLLAFAVIVLFGEATGNTTVPTLPDSTAAALAGADDDGGAAVVGRCAL